MAMHFMNYSWTSMTLNSTTILCLELSDFLLRDSLDREGAKALHQAGMYLLTLQGIESDEYDSREYLDKDEIVEGLSTYFEYLHGRGMDHTSRNIILNAIRYIRDMEWEDVQAMEMVKKKIGWAMMADADEDEERDITEDETKITTEEYTED